MTSLQPRSCRGDAGWTLGRRQWTVV